MTSRESVEFIKFHILPKTPGEGVSGCLFYVHYIGLSPSQYYTETGHKTVSSQSALIKMMTPRPTTES